MGAKKILSYGRFVLMILLVLYLILVWMYFKDNTPQLTASSLLLWFVTIPLLLLGSIMILLWWQKRSDNQDVNTSDIGGEKFGEQETIKQPVTHKLFIYSRVCLPEGNCWSEVIDNDEDLTVLSDDLVDMDGLPILIKPIDNLPDAASLPYEYMIDADTTDSDLNDNSPNSTTLRLYSLIHELLSLSDDVCSTLAEHFDQYYKQDDTQPNSALHIHPEWQQHYLVSANEESSRMSVCSHASLSALPVYLCIPASADSSVLITLVKAQLANYGIPESLLSITPIVSSGTDIADDTETDDTSEFIHEQLIPLSQSPVPELCLILIADSQIKHEWLDAHLYSSNGSNIIPTEAGVLLVFFNQAAQDVLDIDTSSRILLTEIGTPSNKDNTSKNNGHDHHASHDLDTNTGTPLYSNPHEHLRNRHHYLEHLTAIQNLLMDNNLSLSPINADEQTITTQATKAIPKTNVALSDRTITAISDINPLNQLYDVSVYLRFLEAFIVKGALVNEHHLGHYMPLNQWLKPFISLSLFVNSAENSKQESELIFLVTQHKRCSILWLADSPKTSD